MRPFRWFSLFLFLVMMFFFSFFKDEGMEKKIIMNKLSVNWWTHARLCKCIRPLTEQVGLISPLPFVGHHLALVVASWNTRKMRIKVGLCPVVPEATFNIVLSLWLVVLFCFFLFFLCSYFSM